jgi:hypothetical protein
MKKMPLLKPSKWLYKKCSVYTPPTPHPTSEIYILRGVTVFRLAVHF